MKSVSKWSLCFRPPSTIEIDDGVDCSADRMLSLIAAARNSNRLNRNKKKKKQEKNKSPTKKKVLESPIPDQHTSRRSFSSVVKAVVFETSLSRRVRESRSRNRSDQSVRVPPSDQEELIATADQTTAILVDCKSDSDRAAEGNTSAPPASDFRFTSESSKQSEIGAGSAAVRINPVVCLILLSLWVTVFWGRACAVMTTTLGIYAWQSGVVVVGLGEMFKLNKDKKQRAAIEEKVVK